MESVRALLPSLALASLLSACGLTLDYDPPDRQPGFDAGARDGGRGDASTDAATNDGGPPQGCIEDFECDDGDACDGVEQCLDGECVEGEPIHCEDDDVCDGVDACVDGECVTGLPMLCPVDEDPCNGTEVCDPVLGCTTLPPPPCDDGIACTVDSCEPGRGCTHTPDSTLCRDGPGGRCEVDLGGCQYYACNSTTCVPTGCVDAHCADPRTCIYSPLCDFASFCCADTCVLPGCEDGNPCTADSCDPIRGCVHEPVATGTPCDDGDRCTTMDACRNVGTCAGGPPRLCADGDPCTADACDPAVGCTHTTAPNGTMCNDFDACTMGDTCVAGVCAGVARPCLAPIDSLGCVVARCDASRGCMLEPAPSGSPCGPTTVDGVCDGAGHCCGPSTDCDGDGICECPATTTCGFAGGCPGADCARDLDCGLGDACCVRGGSGSARGGFCYPRSCPGCCAAVSAP